MLRALKEKKVLLILCSMCFLLITLPFITYQLYYTFDNSGLVICISISFSLLLLSLILMSIYNNSFNQKKLFLSYNKTLPNINYEDLVRHAKFYNKSPISKNSYEMLLKAREILAHNENSILSRKNFSTKDLKLLSKAGRILFENLEVELLITKDDYIKLEKINEILILETINKIRNSNDSSNLNSPEDNNLENDLDSILDISDRKKIH